MGTHAMYIESFAGNFVLYYYYYTYSPAFITHTEILYNYCFVSAIYKQFSL